MLTPKKPESFRFTTLALEVEHEGGHASMPPKETAIDILAEAIIKIKSNPMSHLFGRGVEVGNGRVHFQRPICDIFLTLKCCSFIKKLIGIQKM